MGRGGVSTNSRVASAPRPTISNSNITYDLEADPAHRLRELCWVLWGRDRNEHGKMCAACLPHNQPPSVSAVYSELVLIHSRQESSVRLVRGRPFQGFPGSLASIHFLCLCLSRSSRSSPEIHPPCYPTGCVPPEGPTPAAWDGVCLSQAVCHTPPLSRLRGA